MTEVDYRKIAEELDPRDAPNRRDLQNDRALLCMRIRQALKLLKENKVDEAIKCLEGALEEVKRPEWMAQNLFRFLADIEEDEMLEDDDETICE